MITVHRRQTDAALRRFAPGKPGSDSQKTGALMVAALAGTLLNGSPAQATSGGSQAVAIGYAVAVSCTR
jgi:hypothetical protein